MCIYVRIYKYYLFEINESYLEQNHYRSYSYVLYVIAYTY